MIKQYAVRYYIKEEYAAYINANNKKEAKKIYQTKGGKYKLFDTELIGEEICAPHLIDVVEE